MNARPPYLPIVCALLAACNALAERGEHDRALVPPREGGGRLDGGAGSAPDPGSASCEAEHPALVVCAVSSVLETNDGKGTRQVGLALDGVVMVVGEGAPPEKCLAQHSVRIGPFVEADSPEISSARWFRISSATGHNALIGVVAPGLEWPFAAGDTISVVYDRGGGGFAPITGRLEVLASDGSLLVWLAIAGSVEDLDPPDELALAAGPTICENTSECVPDWIQSDLLIRTSSQPQVVIQVPYGKQLRAGDLLLTHGGLDSQVGARGCPDAFVAWAAAAAWR